LLLVLAVPRELEYVVILYSELPFNFVTDLMIFNDFWCFSATFNNISAISWRPVLVVEEAGVLGKNHRPWASNW
jgi:hypothetical protein